MLRVDSELFERLTAPRELEGRLLLSLFGARGL
jgi:hypothetical protein